MIELHHAATCEYASGKQSMKWLRTVWDSYALDCLNKELKDTYGLENYPVNFERKTEKDGSYITGLSMDQFKEKQQLIRLKRHRIKYNNQNRRHRKPQTL